MTLVCSRVKCETAGCDKLAEYDLIHRCPHVDAGSDVASEHTHLISLCADDTLRVVSTNVAYDVNDEDDDGPCRYAGDTITLFSLGRPNSDY